MIRIVWQAMHCDTGSCDWDICQMSMHPFVFSMAHTEPFNVYYHIHIATIVCVVLFRLFLCFRCRFLPDLYQQKRQFLVRALRFNTSMPAYICGRFCSLYPGGYIVWIMCHEAFAFSAKIYMTKVVIKKNSGNFGRKKEFQWLFFRELPQIWAKPFLLHFIWNAIYFLFAAFKEISQFPINHFLFGI